MPDRATVFRWIACHDEFRVWYLLARECQQDELMAEALKIADDCPLDRASIERARLRISLRTRDVDGTEEVRSLRCPPKSGRD
jgi:hypothetical protein